MRAGKGPWNQHATGAHLSPSRELWNRNHTLFQAVATDRKESASQIKRSHWLREHDLVGGGKGRRPFQGYAFGNGTSGKVLWVKQKQYPAMITVRCTLHFSNSLLWRF